ncbi:MAG: Rieske 2Fe-2S domain-containing protein [Gemmatimonadaceae bacterium]|nr:Rieske 2Fe-2S domain-containing protein [Gemmatimonadaceae bacterium]
MSADLPVISDNTAMSKAASAPATSACAGCAGVDRRHFLASASWLSLGALAATACGDGVFSGPETLPVFPTENFTVDPRTITELSQVGGRTVLSFGEYAPIYLERIGNAQYRALSLACPHKGSIVSVGSAGFTCPNHGARFDGEGTWIGGQETASLAPLGVKVNVDGTLTIGGAPLPPALSLSTNAVSFTTALGGAQPAAQFLTVDNTGGGVLSGLQVSLAYAQNQRTGWLAVSLEQANTPARLTLTAQRGTLPAGSYNATVTVSAPGISNGAQTVAVTMVVQDPNAPAVLQLSATAISFASTLGITTPTQTVQCINGGGGTLSGLTASIAYAPGGFGWLTANLSATAAPAVLTLGVNPSQVGTGTFTATVTVNANGVASRTIDVSIVVVPQGLVVTIAAWPALANVGGVAGSVGNVAGTPVAVVRSGATSFAAFSMVCPHAGTTIGVVNGTSFRCPNHGALFDNQGILRPDSPQNTDNLTRRTVTYTPGAATLVVT